MTHRTGSPSVMQSHDKTYSSNSSCGTSSSLLFPFSTSLDMVGLGGFRCCALTQGGKDDDPERRPTGPGQALRYQTPSKYSLS